MAASNKDTIYIDVDDEITSIIDKVKSSPSKIVALVLPKRATVLQSIVNMKLLKRSAAKFKKNIVLITSEAGLMPLAGAVGLHVAKTLQSKPAIPPVPHRDDDEETEDKPATSHKAAAGAAGVAAGAALAAADPDDTETIQLDAAEEPAEAAKAGVAAGTLGKIKGLQKLKVPNFEKFRSRFFLGIVGLFLLLIGWYVAFVVMPKATVIIKTDSTSISSSITFTANTAATEFNADQKVVPASLSEVKKADTEKVAATGQKDVGTKATGTMTVYNCPADNNDITLPAGTAFSNSGNSFVTDQAVTVPASGFNSPASGGACKKDKSASVPVTAQEAGDKYNLSSGRDYASSAGAGVTGKGSAMSGGTSKIIKVVSAEDISGATDKMRNRLSTQATDELKNQLGAEGKFALNDTLTTGQPKVTAVPAVGEEGEEITVTAETTYTMLGVKQDDLKALITKEVDNKIDKSKQTILDDGVGNAIFRQETRPSPNEATVQMQALTEAGPQLDEQAIKDSIRGKKRGEAERIITARPGIEDARIEYSPFWVFSTPKAAKKITVQFEKPPVQEASDNADQDTQDGSEQ